MALVDFGSRQDVCPMMPPGITCTLEEWCTSQNPNSIAMQLKCLEPSDHVGLTVVAEAGLVSIAAIAYIMFRIVIHKQGKGSVLGVFKEPNDIFMFSLFLADLLQAIGAAMDIKWIGMGKLYVGGYCTAQGVFQQLGETAVAFASLTIAAYTFFCVWLNTGIQRRITALCVAALTWVPVGIIVLIGNVVPRGHQRQFISPTPYWCWISDGYLPWKIGGEYFWFWFALLFSLVSHLLLFFWLRGNIKLHEKNWWSVKFQRSQKELATLDTSEEPVRRGKAVVMLAYPIVYCCTIVPVSVVRWVTFVQETKHIPPAATFASVAIHDLSGLFNVVLLLTTRSGATLFGGIHSSTEESLSTSNPDIPLTTYPHHGRQREPDTTSEKSEINPPRRRQRRHSVSAGSDSSSMVMHLP